MSTERKHRLTHELIGDMGISLVISLFVLCFLYFMSSSLAERYMQAREIVITDTQSRVLAAWIMSLCIAAGVIVFIVLFLFMSGRRFSYLAAIIKEIDNLGNPGERISVRIEGNDELTELAKSINYMSAAQAEMMDREKQLRERREIFVRNLAHDIRTPLTAMISYSQMMRDKGQLTGKDAEKYMDMMLRRSTQIRELTDRLLDEGRGEPERIDSVKLLLEQLFEEWTETLEGELECEASITGEDGSAEADVYAIRRIMDNLASNVRKYADAGQKVVLSAQISRSEGRGIKVVISEVNAVKSDISQEESRGIGLDSIRRIASLLGGGAETESADGRFSVTVTLYL